MPYFSYISMLHLYESLGWWRRSVEVKKVHFEEEVNEMHHLFIMEALGGDQAWSTRFLAQVRRVYTKSLYSLGNSNSSLRSARWQHSAILYYWTLVLLFALSPSLAYLFSVLLEGHAVDTYEQFAQENKGVLEGLPVPPVARRYYDSLGFVLSGGPKMLDYGSGMTSLYDVFQAIRDDEAEHGEARSSSCGYD